MKRTIISAGDGKADVVPGAPLSDAGREALKGKVDAIYAMFVRDVAAGRRVSEATVRKEFAGGNTVLSADASGRGMIDGVATFDLVLERMATPQGRGRARRTAADVDLPDVTPAPAEEIAAAAAGATPEELLELDRRRRRIRPYL